MFFQPSMNYSADCPPTSKDRIHWRTCVCTTAQTPKNPFPPLRDSFERNPGNRIYKQLSQHVPNVISLTDKLSVDRDCLQSADDEDSPLAWYKKIPIASRFKRRWRVMKNYPPPDCKHKQVSGLIAWLQRFFEKSGTISVMINDFTIIIIIKLP